MLWKRSRNLLIEEAGSCEQSTRDREICMCMTSWCIPGTCRICQIGVVFGSLDTLLTTDEENSTIFLPPDIFHHGKHYNLFYFLDDCFSLMYSITLLIHLFSIDIIHNLIHFYDYTYLVYEWFYNRRLVTCICILIIYLMEFHPLVFLVSIITVSYAIFASDGAHMLFAIRFSSVNWNRR